MRSDAPVETMDAVYAPCSASCPVHTDTRQLVEFIVRGEYEDALELLLAANRFSSVCGRICHHPCEQSCRRTKVDVPVGLRMLKRFVMETTASFRRPLRPARPAFNRIGLPSGSMNIRCGGCNCVAPSTCARLQKHRNPS